MFNFKSITILMLTHLTRISIWYDLHLVGISATITSPCFMKNIRKFSWMNAVFLCHSRFGLGNVCLHIVSSQGLHFPYLDSPKALSTEPEVLQRRPGAVGEDGGKDIGLVASRLSVV